MSTSIETGHYVNLHNANGFKGELDRLGTDYDPSNNRIGIGNITACITAATNAQKNLSGLENGLLPEKKNRLVLMKKLTGIVRRLVRYYKSTPASEELKEAVSAKAMGIVRSKRKQVPETAPPEGAENQTHSSSRLSFVMRVANFRELIDILKSDPDYTANVSDLAIGDLEAFLAELEALNKSISDKMVPVNEARRLRNKHMYGSDGLIVLLRAAKSYVESMYGFNSPEAKAFRNYTFVMRKD